MVRGGWGLIFSEQQEPVGGKNVCSLENLTVLIVGGVVGGGEGGMTSCQSISFLLARVGGQPSHFPTPPPPHKINGK